MNLEKVKALQQKQNNMDIRYLVDTDEIEVVDDYGFPTYHNLGELEQIDTNERELGTEIEYLLKPNIHLFFYPEGKLDDYWIDKE